MATLRAGTYANNGAGASVASSSTTTVTLGAAASAGDMLSLHVIALNQVDPSIPSITAISDTVNGAWSTTPDKTDTSAFYHAERESVFSFPNSAAGTPVITVTLSNTGASAMNVGLQCAAFSSVPTSTPVDVSVVGSGTSSTPSSGATAATGAANELVVGFYGDFGEGTTIVEGAGYTLAGKHASDSGKYQALMEYKDSGSSGNTPSAGVTLGATTGGWKMFAVVYKSTGGGATTAYKDTPTRFKLVAGAFKNTFGRFKLVSAAAWKNTPARFRVAVAFPVHFYHTSFPATENPMSEGSIWAQGKLDGTSWKNIRTTTNKAFGTQDGVGNAGDGSSPGIYDDSVALLRGTWGRNQHVRGVAFNTRPAGDFNTEVELWVRGNITPTSTTGYEIEYSCRSDNPYFDIVRWNGAIGDFTPLTLSTGGTHLASMPGGPVADGDVLDATIVGSLISAYRNGVLIATATDTTYTTGFPGFGHFLHTITATGDPTLYGFSDYTAETIFAFRDTPTRLRLASSLLWRNTATRLRLLANAVRDTPSRFRLASVATWKNTPTRLQLASAAVWKNTPTRFNLTSTTLWRFTATRFQLASATVWRNTPTRLQVAAAAIRDTPTRWRLLAVGYRHTATRFVLQTAGTTWRHTATRFSLASVATWRFTASRFSLATAAAYHFTAGRFALASAAVFHDTPARLRLASTSTWHHTATRFGLVLGAWRFTATRWNLTSASYRHTATRFIVLTNAPIVVPIPNFEECETDLTLAQRVIWA